MKSFTLFKWSVTQNMNFSGNIAKFNLYNKALCLYIYMLAIAGQTTKPNWQKFI